MGGLIKQIIWDNDMEEKKNLTKKSEAAELETINKNKDIKRKYPWAGCSEGGSKQKRRSGKKL